MLRSLIKGVGGLWLAGMLVGCSTIEFAEPAAIPEVTVQPKTDAVEHPSPPALETETVTKEPPVTAPAEPGKPLNLTVEGAIVLALEHNQDLLVEEVNPALKQTFVSEQRSAFDPVLVGSYTGTEDRLTRDLLVQKAANLPNVPGLTSVSIWEPVETVAKTRTDAGSVGVTQHLPTGADVSLAGGQSDSSVRNSTTDPSLDRGINTDTKGPNLSLTVTQSLLRGAGLSVNLASLRQARIDTRLSHYEMRGVAENLVSQVEQTYWDYVLAQRQIAIYEQALTVAQTQLDQVNEQIHVGRLPESERAAAAAEVASRHSLLINARSNLATTRLSLLRLLNPSDDALQNTDIQAQSVPVTPEIAMSAIDDSVKLAKRMRPDLNQARLQIERDDLDVVKTKNGLLPQLDVFLKLANSVNETTYAQSFVVSPGDTKDTHYNAQVGVQFSYPIGNRGARARDERAALTREKDLRALANMAQLVEQDVRTAYVEVGRSREQIAATAATRKLQEETLQSETEKFRVGRSNVLLVAQAERDLLTAQINEVQAKAAYLKAIVNLYRLEGSLLERRGVLCPGRDPVELANAPVAVSVQAGGDVGATTK